MNLQSKQQVTILFELLTEGTYEADVVLVNAIGQDVITASQGDGSFVRSIETGAVTRGGGEVLVEIITAVTNVAAYTWAHKEVIERVLTDAGSLMTICTGVVPVLRHLFQSHRQRTKQTDASPGPLKITLEIDGAPVTVEAADVEDAEAALKMAQRFLAHHPNVASKVTPHSKVKVKARLPPQPRRKRR